MEDTARLFDDAEPELVFHLAAEVGGIGANRANPGRYWYANLMMGAHVLEQARLHGTPKLVIAGTICAYPEVRPGPVPRGRPLERLPRGDERALRRREEGDPRRRAGVPRAVRRRTSIFLLPVEPLRAGRQLRPRDVARDPRADPQDGRGAASDDEIVLWGDGSPTREFLYVDDCVEGLALAAERYDGAEPVNLGTGEEIVDPRARRARRATSTGFAGRDPSGTRRSRTASRAAGSTRRARASSSASRRRSPLRDGHRTHRRLVPRTQA